MTTIIIRKDTPLPERMSDDLYETERTLIHATLQRFLPGTAKSILDPGAGDGRWGQIAGEYLPEAWITGVELRLRPRPAGFSEWHDEQDYLTWETGSLYSVICGNPPFFLAEEFVRKSWELLAPGGVMFFLLRLAFMEGVDRHNHLWREIWPFEVAVCSRRPSFYGGKTNGTAHAVFCWKKGFDGDPVGEPRTWRTSLLLHERDKNHRGVTPKKLQPQNRVPHYLDLSTPIDKA